MVSAARNRIGALFREKLFHLFVVKFRQIALVRLPLTALRHVLTTKIKSWHAICL
jgi:hypothetical protein